MRSTMLKMGFAVGCALAACVAMNASVAYQTIQPGGSINPLFPGPQPDGSEQLLGQDLDNQVAFPATFTARVESKYYENYAGSPYSGGFTFEYKVINTTDRPYPTGSELLLFGIRLLPAADPARNELGVGYREPLSGRQPNSVAMGNINGQLSLVYEWVVTGGLTETESSATLFVHSPYPTFRVGTAWVAGTGAVADGFRVFAPIPEPTSYAGLFALGLAGFAAYRRFRV